MAALPTYLLSSPPFWKALSFVAKVGNDDVLVSLGSSELVHGADGFAVVTTLSEEHYFVVTVSDRRIDVYQPKLAQ